MSVIPFSGTVATSKRMIDQFADGKFDIGDITAPAAYALDVLGWVTDPFGALAGAVLGPLLDYLANNFPPLKWPLDRLAGDQGAIKQKAEAWQQVSDRLVAIGNQYASSGNDMPTWKQGTAQDDYRAIQEMLVTAFQGAANQAAGVAKGIAIVGGVCGGVRDVIWGIVKDFVTSAVGNAIAAAASALVTCGGSIGAFCTWFAGRFAAVMGKISNRLAKLMEYMSRVTSKWTGLSKAFQNAANSLRAFSRSQIGRAGGLAAAANNRAGQTISRTTFDQKQWQENLSDRTTWPGRGNTVADGADKGKDESGVGNAGTVDGLS